MPIFFVPTVFGDNNKGEIFVVAVSDVNIFVGTLDWHSLGILIFFSLSPKPRIFISGLMSPVTNAINVLHACIYKSVKQAYF